MKASYEVGTEWDLNLLNEERGKWCNKSMVDVSGELMGPFGSPLKDWIQDKMLIKKWLEVPVLKYDAANKIWLGKKAICSMKLVEIISLKKMRQDNWRWKLTGIKRSVCFAQVVPVMHVADLLVDCTAWKGNKDTHTAKNGYDRHAGDLEAFRDGQGRSWSALGFRSYYDFCGSSIITRGSCTPVWDCHPGQKHFRRFSNPGRGRRWEIPSAHTGSDRCSLEWEGTGWAGLAELSPQGRPPTLHTANCSSASQVLHCAGAIS